MSQEPAVKRLTELETMFFSSVHDLQMKLVNVLLVASAACIGFAVTQTKETSLTLYIMPWGLALLAWAGSFFFGCRSIFYKSEHMWKGMLFLREGINSYYDNKLDEALEKADEMIDSEGGLKEIGRLANKARSWQFYLFIVGAVFFIIWHILEMWLRTAEKYTCLLWS